MKALAIFAASVLAVSPFASALALGRAAPPNRQGHHEHFPRGEVGLGGIGAYAPEIVPAPGGPEADEPAPLVEFAPAPRCPAPPRVATRSSGPRILYVGHAPAMPANAPKVIYGVN